MYSPTLLLPPQKRKTEIKKLTAALSKKIKTAQNGSDAEAAVDEAVFAADDLRKAFRQINRHRELDSLHPDIQQVDKVWKALKNLYDDLGNNLTGEQKTTLQNLQGRAEQLTALTGGNYPAMVISNFFNHTIFSQAYLREYESELEDESVAANTARPLVQFIRFWVLNDLGEKGLLGEKDWFFFKPGVDYLVRPYMLDKRSFIVDPNDKPLNDNPIQAIVNFRNVLKRKNIELLVVIVPGKPTIYPEMLNKTLKDLPPEKLTHSFQAMADLEAQGVETVNLFGPFAAEKKKDANASDKIYLKKDTHWRARGLKLAAKTVADRVKQYSWFKEITDTLEYIEEKVTVERVGDVGIMTQMPAFKVRGLTMNFKTETTEAYRVFQITRDSSGTETGRRPFKDDYRRSKILVLGDSFSRIYQTDEPRSAGWIAHLAKELSVPLGSIVSDGGASTLVRQKLARKAKVLRGKKLVIWEFVERDFRFGAEGWKDVEIKF